MTFEVESGGRRFTVDLRRAGAAWQVTVDGRMLSVDVTEVSGRLSLLIADGSQEDGHYTPPVVSDFSRTKADVVSGFSRTQEDVVSGFSRTRARRSFDVSIELRNRDAAARGNVIVNGAVVPVSIRDPRARRGRHGGAESGSGPQHVVAPMPGRIVRVLVRPGQTVAPRQGLVVVEAMKMENELRATRAGTVSEVRVSEGSLVEAKTVLVTLE